MLKSILCYLIVGELTDRCSTVRLLFEDSLMSVVKYQQFLKSYVLVYNCTITRNTTTISKLVNTSFAIWSGQCIMLRNTALL